jgi:cell shape-determining protein MreD
MRIPCAIYAVEFATLVGANVLLGVAFGWVVGAVFGAGLLVFVLASLIVAKLLKRRRSAEP